MNITTSPAPSDQRTRFEGSDQYVATDDLKLAVNASMTLQRPLLIKGEPGTGTVSYTHLTLPTIYSV